MRKAQDLTGRRFHRWTVVERSGNIGTRVAWRCRCDCGAVGNVTANCLTLGKSKSCGCLQREVASRVGLANTKHGKNGTTLYGLWVNIRNRVTNESLPQYKNYGGRGIQMWTDWLDNFEAFESYILVTLGEKPDGMSLDRVDCDGNYEPGNLRWATDEQQQRNTRQNVWVKYQGRTVLQADLARELGVSASTINHRIRAGKYQAHKGLKPLGD